MLSRVCWTLATLGMRLWYAFAGLLFSIRNAARARLTVTPVTNPLLLLSATKLAAMIKDRQVSSEQVLLAYIERIKHVNPLINAVVVENFEQALSIARAVDEMLSRDEVDAAQLEEKPLLGVPFTLKDAILVQGLVCSAGLYARRHARSRQSAVIVQRLQAAGAIPLAVTNVSEACMWMESSNCLYGRTRNPYDHRRTVGGSSGGEAGLLASGGSVIGLGSDIGGSLRMPAYFCGIFSHKPSDYIMPLDGMVPEASGTPLRMLEPGPMCRYFEDLAPMLSVLAGPEAHQLRLDEKVDVSKLRYFYMEQINTPATSCVASDVRGALKKVLHYVEKRHSVLCHRLDLPAMHWALPLWLNDMAQTAPGSPTFTQEMTDRQGDVRLLTELPFRYALGRSRHTFPALALGAIEKFDSIIKQPQRSRQFTAMRERLQMQFADLLGDNGVLLFPSHPCTAPFHNQPIAQPFNWIYTAIFNSLTLPTTQVPLGLNSSGIPTGIQVVANSGQDRLCLAVAKELNTAFGGWKSPGRPV